MFYSQFLLSKKGPFGVIWIAAHLERKLRKKQITETDIGDSVDSILYSEVPIALRISSHLLLGVVRIYARKVNYLFHDCSETLVKIAQAFQTSAINLPAKAVVAPYHTITLPESFNFDDLGAYIDPEDAARAGTWAEFEHHVTDRDLITLQEPMEVRGISQSLFTLDGGFSEGPNPYTVSSLPTEDQISRKIHVPQDIPQDIPVAAPADDAQARVVEEDILPPLPMEEVDTDLEDMDNGRERNFVVETRPELEGAVEDVDKTKVVEVEDAEVTRASTTVLGQEAFVEVERTTVHREGPMPMDIDIHHLVQKEVPVEEERHDIEEVPFIQVEKRPARTGISPPKSPRAAHEEDVLGTILGVTVPKPAAAAAPPEPPQRRKRKRKLHFDNVPVITSFNMKRQLGSSSDLVRHRKKAPCTEYQIWMAQRDNIIDQKFSGTSLPGMCPELKNLSNHILNLEAPEPNKDKMRGATKHVDEDSDMEEVFHEGNGLETIATVKQTTEAEVVSTPPPSPQPVAAVAKIEIDAVTIVKRRLEFEKPTEEVMEREVEAQPAEPSPSRLPTKDGATAAAAAAEVEAPIADAAGEAPIASVAEGTEIQFVPNAALDIIIPEKAVLESVEASPKEVTEEEPVAQTSADDLSDELQSQGLAFLADSQEAGNGAIVENGAWSYSSSFDAESEHFGKLMQDKSGWASRSRAVALYLKEKFEAQSMDEQLRLSLGNILKGRRRKEVARMFLEILMLRSKDYIQVEQQDGVSDIYIAPTERLMKGSW